MSMGAFFIPQRYRTRHIKSGENKQTDEGYRQIINIFNLIKTTDYSR